MGSRQPLGPNADRGLIMHVSESWGAGRSSVRASLGNSKSKLGLRRRSNPRPRPHLSGLWRWVHDKIESKGPGRCVSPRETLASRDMNLRF